MGDTPARQTRATMARAGAMARARWVRVFLAHLAETSNVSAAARKAKVANARVYELRRVDAGFRAAWQAALMEGYDNLEMDLLARLRSGEIKPAPGAKRSVRAFDNATALRLLTAHRESVARGRAVRENEDAEAVLASLNAKLDRMRERMLGGEDEA